MLPTVVVAFFASLAIFLFVLILVGLERRKRKRFLLPTFRAWIDKVLFVGRDYSGDKLNHFVRYILQLHWYYGIHSFLRGILTTIAKFYSYIENILETNRNKARQIRREKRLVENDPDNHLTHIASNRVETALTPTQQRKRKNKELEGKHWK